MQCGAQRDVACSAGGSYLRLIDSCITQLKAQGPSMTCNESNEEGTERGASATVTVVSTATLVVSR